MTMPRYKDADALRKAMYHEAFEKDSDEQRWDSGCWIRYKLFERVFNSVPTIDVPERKVGKWIDNNGLYQCSVCKHIWSELWWTSICPIDRMNKMMRFCPNCGARMKGEEDGNI